MSSVNDKRVKRNNQRCCTKCELLSYQDICPYCHSVTVPYTGQTRSENPIDKPIVELKEIKEFTEYNIAILVFGNIVIGLLYMVILLNKISDSFFNNMFLISVEKKFVNPFIYMAILIALIVFQVLFNVIYLGVHYSRVNTMKTKGKTYECYVHGYTNDRVRDFNHNQFQILQLEINTPERQGIILSRVRSAIRSYNVGDMVQIKIYKNNFFILNKKVGLYRAEPDYHFGGYVDDTSNETIKRIPCKSLHVDKKIQNKYFVILFICLMILFFVFTFDIKTLTLRPYSEAGLLFGPFLIIFLIIVLIYNSVRDSRIKMVKNSGTYLDGVIIGYTDSIEKLNHEALTAVKIRIETPEGPRCLVYDLHAKIKPYELNQHVKLLKYQDYYLIVD